MRLPRLPTFLLAASLPLACTSKSVGDGVAFTDGSAVDESGGDDSTGGGGSDTGGSPGAESSEDGGLATDSGDGSDGGGDAAGTTGGGDDAGEPSFGSGSAFDDVMQMFDYFNENRMAYLSHDRWRGMPFFGGSSHTTTTWPTTFMWDAALAAQAQVEAEALAAGASPQGQSSSDGIIAPIYLAGVDTAHYMITGKENANSWEQENQSSLGREHGSARMAMYYHDAGGEGPVLSRIGIGAADAGGGDTWWVLVLE